MTDVIGRDSGGRNPLGYPGVLPPFYSATTVRPALVEVWWRYEGEIPSAARLIGRYLPGQRVSFPYTPIGDKNIILSTISISAAGVRSVRDIRDAKEFLVVFQRETDAPTVTQVGAASYTLITLAIAGYSALAFQRRVRTADDAGMTTNLDMQITDVGPGATLPRLVYLTRPTPGSGTRTIYVRVSHSSGGAYGTESAAAAFTWADSGGAGGGTGSGDPLGGDSYTCFSGNVKIRTPAGWQSFNELVAAAIVKSPFLITNETGINVAELIIHEYDGPMIDMGDGELVTPEHAMKQGASWIPASARFPGCPRVHFKGEVFNLHILSADPADQHYLLANGEIAHNVKIAG
jgi:hypothetical protein